MEVLVDVTVVTDVDVATLDVVVVENVLVVVVLVERKVVRGGVVTLKGPKTPVAGEVTSVDRANTDTTTTASCRAADCKCFCFALLKRPAS